MDKPGVKRRRKSRLPAWVLYPLLGAFIALLAIAGRPALQILSGGKVLGQTVVAPPLGGRSQINLLILGLDQPDRLFPEKIGRRSDTMLLAHVDLLTKEVTGVSIPRDTRVRLEHDKPWTKINSAYTDGGVDGAIRIVQEITGVSPDYFVVVDTASTKRLVDLVGGVTVTVDKRMKYDDNWGDLHINLRPGTQRLNGEQAVGFLRFRHDATGDIARMKRQQQFIRSMAEQMLQPANLPKLPWIVSELHRQVKTNMSDADLLYLARQMKDVPASHLVFHSLDGESRMIRGVSYFLPYGNKMRERIAEAFPNAPTADSPDVDTL